MAHPDDPKDAFNDLTLDASLYVALRAALRALPHALFLAVKDDTTEAESNCLQIVRSLVRAHVAALANRGVDPSQEQVATLQTAMAWAIDASAHVGDWRYSVNQGVGFLRNAGRALSAAVDGHASGSHAKILPGHGIDPDRNVNYRLARSNAVQEAASDLYLEFGALLVKPLWTSDWEGSAVHERFVNFVLGCDDESWSFWLRWFQAYLRGEPLQTDILAEIALFPDGIWEAGPARVAEEIAKIETNHILTRLPQPETIEYDEAEELFYTQPSDTGEDELLASTFRQMDFGLKVALQSNCGLNTNATAYLYITHTVETCASDPNAAVQNMRIARDDLEAGLASGFYADDQKLRALISILEQAELDLLANHSAVAEAWEKRASYRLKSVRTETRISLAEKSRELAEATADKTKREMQLDAQVVETHPSPDAQATAARRLLGRAAGVRKKVGELVQTVDASSGYKLTRMGQVASDIVGFFSELFKNL